MEATDGALVNRAVGGEATAFDALVRRHTPRMYRVALRVVGNAADAEDVVQEAWISAWRGLGSFRQDAAVSTWLYRVVSNTAIAHVRKRKPAVSLDADLAADGGGPAPGESLAADPDTYPEARAVQAAQIDAVLRAIGTLEPGQRVPLVLHELEGFSYAEVAEIMQVSATALRSRLHRARVALLERLKELE
ncbi:sigma-70 family RNA polymerase sigma factor [Haloechinothrix sp. LS1_15]|uniref:RNA polymerase sigma factor n=1 Tax=Haloechinothrix sp. LS1_15 TaxID=2652248 RepID=UPI0029488F60|nr:sigma-70 family RNA polymerase sigma factor [Haloechinothrix sp. LS1_15]MDV6011390.1 sigma-70 family RNA polymerase sigma factor [Haloechinothrix sp. LS1_15]